MIVAAQVLVGLNMLMHVYIFLLETVLFNSRGRRAFGISSADAVILKPAMSNQGCYNGFLALALLIGLIHPNMDVARVWGAVTVKKTILLFQTVPALTALVVYHLAYPH
jgi:putative membrane protein